MPAHTERRQTIRINVNGTLSVEGLSAGQALHLVDIGTGGFSVRSPAAIAVNATAAYRFSAPDKKWSAIFGARAVYCRLLAPDGQTPHYLTGLVFVNTEAPDMQRQLMLMIDLATSLSFS